jgi:hypothetical protein
MSRPQYLDLPYDSPPPAKPSGNGATPLPSLPERPAASVSSPAVQASPVAEFVNDVLTGKYTPPPDPSRTPFVAPADERPPAAVPRRAIPPFKMEPEKPAAPASTDALLQAIDKVYRVAMDRIAYHEREAKKLREALVPFASLHQPGAEAPPMQTAESFIQSVITMAGKLPETQP